MHNPINDVLFFFVVVVLLPILTYFIVKFGAAGYFSAKRIWDKSFQKDNEESEQEKE
jgi:hypothetical protein